VPRALAPRAIAGSLARTVALLAVAFVVVAALLTLMQDRLLYHPEPASVAEVAVGGIAAWPSSDDFRGLLIEPVGQHGRAARATVIVFHGNAGHAGHRRWYAEALGPLGLRVLLAEYPGYGPRKGKLGEARLVADAAQTIAAARRAFGEPILLLGESLGAGVAAAAAHAAGPDAGISGLLLVTPWDRLVNVAAFHYPWLPVTWLLKDGYDSAANLASARLPVTVAVATNDGIVPARFGIALHDALPPPKTLLVIEGASHNDWPGRVDADWWRRAIEPLLPLR
jgi:uncharacterized protein